MPRKAEILTGPLCHRDALRKARYGHNDWICWLDKSGNKFAARMTYESLKSAMLANGTKGRAYWMYQSSSGCCWGMFWQQAVNFLANLKQGTYR